MRAPRLAGLVLAASAAAACTSLPPPQTAWDPAAKFSGWKSYSWAIDPAEDKGVGSSIVDPRFVDEHVREAVESELSKKGYRRVEGDDADFRLDYHTQTGAVRSQDRFGAYTWWSGAVYAGSESRREATLTLDVRDRAMKLVWRGSITRLAGGSPEKISRAIKRAVAEILATFPPK